MATQTVQRQLELIVAAFNGQVDTGFLFEQGNKFYIPVTFNNFTTPDFTIPVNATATETTITAVNPGGFDEVRVGDELVEFSGVGTLDAIATVDIDCYCPKGQYYVVFPSNLTEATLGVKAGDAVTGATPSVIPASTTIDKIDYATKRIFLNNAIDTAGDIVDSLTFTPPARVIAVRPSTDSVNANQIDIDTTIGTTATGEDLTISNGAKEAVTHVWRIEPISNSVGSKAQYQMSFSTLDGTAVKGSANGLNNIDFTSLTYVTVGNCSFDADRFLINARLPRPTAP